MNLEYEAGCDWNRAPPRSGLVQQRINSYSFYSHKSQIEIDCKTYSWERIYYKFLHNNYFEEKFGKGYEVYTLEEIYSPRNRPGRWDDAQQWSSLHKIWRNTCGLSEAEFDRL